MQKIKQMMVRLFDPIDIAPLIIFRIAFGALMLWEVWRYFNYDRIARYYVDPSFFFHYWGFEWLQPLPGDGMFWLFHFLGFLSVMIMLGVFYRISMTLFCLCFTYVFLLDSAQYLNHFYLVSLISFLLIFIPANRAWSVDVLLMPKIRTQVVPLWSLCLFRAQMGLVYFFGGIAKINPDWLAGEPLRQWMGERTDFPIIGVLFTEEWMVYLFSYGGLLLDLFIVPFLLWRRTRIPALLLAIGFHITNANLFNIGIFPWFAIVATLMFLPPHWFRPLMFWTQKSVSDQTSVISSRRWVLIGMGVYFAIQIALPLRHWLYPGDPSWTEEGHALAWHMRLRSKDGSIAFYANDPTTGNSWQLSVEDYLSARQYDQMVGNPDMILRFVHYLGNIYPNTNIYVHTMMSLNSRAPQLLIDPTANLVVEQDDLITSDWILPLVQQPVPNDSVPALLVSRRHNGVLMLVNITESNYPLNQLNLRSGEQQFSGLDFGVAELLPNECVMAHVIDANLQAVYAPCNETGSRIILSAELLNSKLEIDTGTTKSLCQDVTCVVTSNSPIIVRR